MAERRILNIIFCFFALHALAQGFKVDGYDINEHNQLLTQERCLIILATDLETYDGMLLFHVALEIYFHGFIFQIVHTFQILEHLP